MFRIHISATAKELLDKVGGFRCEYRGVLDIGVSRDLNPLTMGGGGAVRPSLPFFLPFTQNYLEAPIPENY